MTRVPDKEFERLAVLHAMGALSEQEAARFREARQERGQQGDRLVQGVERAFAGTGPGAPAPTVPSERADLAAVTSRPIETPMRWPWIAALLVVSAVAVGAVAWALSLQNRLEDARSARAAATARADTLTAAVAERDTALMGVPDVTTLTGILADPALRVLPLEGEGETTGRLLASPGGGGALLVVTGLPVGEDPYRLVTDGPDGTAPVAALGPAPEGFLFAVFPSAGFLDDARVLRIVAPPEDEAGSDRTILEGFVPFR